MPIHPIYDFKQMAGGVRLEFESVMGLGIGDDVFVVGSELVKEAVRQVIADDAVLAREQEQGGHRHGFGGVPEVKIEANVLHEKSGGGLVKGQGIEADKIAPALHLREQVWIVERDGE